MKLTTALEDLGANCIEAPAIKIANPDDEFTTLDSAISKITEYEWIIFTSTNGVDRFFARLFAKSLDARCLANAKIAAIGTSTADKLKNYGIIADKVPTMFMAEGILNVLKEDIKEGTKVLIPRAQKAREALPIGLRELGAVVDVAETYCTKMADTNKDEIKTLLKEHKVDMVTFTSSSTVENLLKLIDDEKNLLDNVAKASIGPITANTCRKHGLTVDVEADIYTIDGLVEKIKNFGW